MKKMKIDAMGRGYIAWRRSEAPEQAVRVARAKVSYGEHIGPETFWLRQENEAGTCYTLWFEPELLPGRYHCCARIEADEPLVPKHAAWEMLLGVWEKRFPGRCRLLDFTEAGIIKMPFLKDMADVFRRASEPRAGANVEEERTAGGANA